MSMSGWLRAMPRPANAARNSPARRAMVPVTGERTGWDAWSQPAADAARSRHDFREARLRRERDENDARLAAKAVQKMREVTAEATNTPEELAEKERKRAIIAAAMERARLKAAGNTDPT